MMNSLTRLLSLALARGLALVAAVQLPGALADCWLRRALGEPLRRWAWVAVAAIVSTVVARALRARAPLPQASRSDAWAAASWPLALAVAVGATLALTRLAPPPVTQIRWAPHEPLALYGGDIHDCRLPPRCRDYHISARGLRAPDVRRAAPDERVVAMIGDSHVFGYGVDDDETLPARLAERLATLRPPARVANAGVEGTSLTTFPAMARYAVREFDPDLVVALIKGDDLEDEDHTTRLIDVSRSLRARVLYALNLELPLHIGRELVRKHVRLRPDPRRLVERLDALRRATAARGLLLVTDLDPALDLTLAAWRARHPEVRFFASREAPGWHEAPRIPNDGHWSPEGNRWIADAIAPAVAAALAAGRPSSAD